MENIKLVENPCIGSSRNFFSNISVDPFAETLDSIYSPPSKNNLENEQLQKENTCNFENIMMKNLANIKQYKDFGGRLIYHDDEVYKKYSIIDYNLLMTILSCDETSNESFISKIKGLGLLNKKIKRMSL